MNQPMRDLARRVSPRLFAVIKGLRLAVDRESFLVTSGLIHSYATDYPCRPDGSPLPWINYNVIELLDRRLKKDMLLFEYGSGYSTLYFAARVGRVFSVEHDLKWYNRVLPQLPPNVDLLYRSMDDLPAYCSAILDTRHTFDVVVIDGRERITCAQTACQALSSRGVIIFDDAQREKYAAGTQWLLAQGFRRIDFTGFKPVGISLDRTSIFYRSGNCLDI